MHGVTREGYMHGGRRVNIQHDNNNHVRPYIDQVLAFACAFDIFSPYLRLGWLRLLRLRRSTILRRRHPWQHARRPAAPARRRTSARRAAAAATTTAHAYSGQQRVANFADPHLCRALHHVCQVL